MRVGVMFAAACLIPLLDRFNSVAPGTEVVLVDMTTPAEWNGQADIVVDWGTRESDATMVADKLTSDEEIFPVCGPGVCRDGSLAGATFLSLARAGEPWHWPDWPEFLAAVGLSHPGGPRPPPVLRASPQSRAQRPGGGAFVLHARPQRPFGRHSRAPHRREHGDRGELLDRDLADRARPARDQHLPQLAARRVCGRPWRTRRRPRDPRRFRPSRPRGLGAVSRLSRPLIEGGLLRSAGWGPMAGGAAPRVIDPPAPE